MKTLIAIPSCHAEKFVQLRQACRDTWVGKWGHLVDIKFFLGLPLFPSSLDEISLDAPDTYKLLPLKVRAMFIWILAHGYDRILKCDDDTYVHVPRLLACGKDAFDYVGRLDNPNHYTWWMHGGAGYWLSRRMMEYLVNLPLSAWQSDWREDRTVGLNARRACQLNGWTLAFDNKRLWDSHYPQYPSSPKPDNQTITAHKCDVARHHAIHAPFASI